MLANPSALACAMLSMFSGLAGYKLAITQAPAYLKEYITAVTFGSLIQATLSAIISHRKDKITSTPNDASRKFRNDFVSTICATLISISAAAALTRQETSQLFIYLTLSLVSTLLQNTTYDASSIELLHSPDRFWQHQLAGALTRLTLTTLLIWQLKMAFTGILIANIGAAAIICLRYRCAPTIHLKIRDKAWRNKELTTILTLDGLLRSLKGQYESVATSFASLAINRFLPLNPDQSIACLASVGYINTVNVLLRQTLSNWEHPDKNTGSPKPALLAIALLVLATFAAWIATSTGLTKIALPDLSLLAEGQLLTSCIVAATLFPFTRGYLYCDYLPPEEVSRLSQKMALSYLMLLGTFMAISLMANTNSMIAYWAAIMPLSISFSLKKQESRSHA